MRRGAAKWWAGASIIHRKLQGLVQVLDDDKRGDDPRTPLEMLNAMRDGLRIQADRLIDQSTNAAAFEKCIPDGMFAVARAWEKLAAIQAAVDQSGELEQQDMADIDAFFAEVEGRIEQRTQERLAAAQADIACPECGAAMRPVGAAGGPKTAKSA